MGKTAKVTLTWSRSAESSRGVQGHSSKMFEFGRISEMESLLDKRAKATGANYICKKKILFIPLIVYHSY